MRSAASVGGSVGVWLAAGPANPQRALWCRRPFYVASFNKTWRAFVIFADDDRASLLL